jgi:hypothetical protein
MAISCKNQRPLPRPTPAMAVPTLGLVPKKNREPGPAHGLRARCDRAQRTIARLQPWTLRSLLMWLQRPLRTYPRLSYAPISRRAIASPVAPS